MDMIELIKNRKEEIEKIYFKKTYNRFTDYDKYLTTLFKNLIEQLNLTDEIQIQICNKIIGVILN